ncbi:MAG: acyl-CoA dehydrogenase [Deltaproteobacteria bacterium]|nr:acyl-CoA dehydrogenase [Deltaproteobacteria bacterium]
MRLDFDDPGLFSFEDSFAGLSHLGTIKKKAILSARKDFEAVREFAQHHLRPLVLSADLAVQKDKNALPDDILALAVKHRMLSLFIPGFIGGGGSGVMYGINPCIEEMSSVDPAFQAGVLAGHGLGMAALTVSQNLKIFERVAAKVVSEERAGRPYLVDCAITEPMAGSDVEEFDLLPHARLVSRAGRVEGGALISGNKCFISGGHTANLHVIVAPFDLKRPAETLSMFLVPKDSPGFNLGRIEEKMGMKAGSASELVFDGCFVPNENIVYDGEDIPAAYRERILHSVLGMTRIAVGAMGTGVARGAFETALAFAKTRLWKGKTLIHHQWAQEMLTNMLMNVYMARAVYLEAGCVLFTAVLPGALPAFMNARWFERLYQSPIARRIRYSQRVRDAMLKGFFGKPREDNERLQFYSSLAKVVGSDTGMENCHLALEMMGEHGLRHEAGAEKLFRDIKLCQIFEGTNQLNRLHMFNHFIARNLPGVNPFSGGRP